MTLPPLPLSSKLKHDLGLASDLKHSVLYLRVSTPRQMDTAIDIDPDGNSIATQREFGQRRAEALNAVVDKIFIEPGNSAQSIEKRPVFREVLAYLREHPEVDYVIIYMRSRAFRNFTDAALTKRQLAKLGVKLVSAKEDFGEGYVADAMEGIIDIFNELEVRRNGEDIKAKMRYKALNGGTIARAKIGYLNVRSEQDGRLFNSIGLDPKRASLVRQVFELYSTGDYSIELLHTTMTDLGLTSRATAHRPEKPVSANRLHQILSDPYYAGWVIVDGQLYPGRHQPIVSQDLFDRVQDVLDARSRRGQRDRVTTHYLKGILYCDRCHREGRTSRLIYTEARSRTGDFYGYYVCRGRQQRLCDLPHLPVAQVEDAISRNYRALRLPESFLAEIGTLVEATMADEQRATQELHDSLTKQLAKLEAREERLIDLAADGLLSRNKIQERSNAIQLEKACIQVSLSDTSAQLELGAERLRTCLDLVQNVPALYERLTDRGRRLANHTFYRCFYLDELPDQSQIVVSDSLLNPPFDEIQQAAELHSVEDVKGLDRFAEAFDRDHTPVLGHIFLVDGSSKQAVVGLVGVEPTTKRL